MPNPTALRIEYVPLNEILDADRNAKEHDVPAIARSIVQFGFADPVLIDERTGRLIGGHGRLKGLRRLRDDNKTAPSGVDPADGWRVPVTRGWASISDEHAEAANLALNRVHDLGGYDNRALAEILDDLFDTAPDYAEAAGYVPGDLDALLASFDDDPLDDDDGGERDESWDDPAEAAAEQAAADDPAAPRPTLADRFLIPPFDVLDSRQGWWQARKKRWLALGIKSELGRSARATYGTRPPRSDEKTQNGRVPSQDSRPQESGYSREQEKGLVFGAASSRDPTYYAQKTRAEAAVGRALTAEEFEAEHYTPSSQYESGTSIFDPVLCELIYRWFSAAGHTVLDPFAGGSVRGLVAAMLKRSYLGNDLRPEQIDANNVQADDFARRGLIERDAVSWAIGDSAEWVKTLRPESADMIMTCPPYLWLEKYSDDPADLSNLGEQEFDRLYRAILAGAARALRRDRYAVLVVGDVRDSKGRLIDFRGMTVAAAEAAGLTLLSAAVLVTPVGSLAVRAPRSFEATRVLGRTHQDVLVFVKGDRRAAAQACGVVEVSVPEGLGEDDGGGVSEEELSQDD